MKYINKFETTEEYTQALGVGGQLADLEHFVAYTKDTDTVYLKEQPKPSYLIYQAEGGVERDMIKRSILITNRCDLIKTLKIDGVEQDLEVMGKERTPHVFTATTENDKLDEIYKIIIGEKGDKYIFEIIEPEAGKEYKVEIEWFDNITDGIMIFIGCERLISIPSDLFSNCTQVTSFGGTFSGCFSLATIPSDLFSNCTQVTSFSYTFSGCTSLTVMPKDSDGMPIYKRSGDGKVDYAIVTDSGGCFCGCEKIEGKDSIPDDWYCGV